MIRKTIHTLAVFGVLFAVWCVLSGIFTPFFFALGFAACFFATAVTRRMEVIDSESHPFELIYLGPVYWFWLAKEMVVSGLAVTRKVWQLEPNFKSGFGWVRIRLTSDLGRAIFANSLTLTPGTVCVDLKHDRAYIHALDKTDLEDMGIGEVERRVERITARAAPSANRQRRKRHGRAV